MGRIFSYFEAPAGGGARWLPMEGMRGLAVFLVFLVHYSAGTFNAAGIWPGYLEFVRVLGTSGVDIFFVLSGFLIYRAIIRKPINHVSYAWRRVERIYPAFVFALCLYLVADIFFVGSISKLPEDGAVWMLLANLLLLPGILPIDAIVPVAWSLSYEALFYLVVPILVGGLRMRRWPPLLRLVVFTGVGVGVLYYAMTYYNPHFRLAMFLGGMALYEIVCLRPSPKSSRALDCLALMGFGAAIVYFAYDNRSMSYLYLNVAVVFLLYRCLFTDGLAAALFSFAPLRWLGNMSYTYYLIHTPGLYVFFGVLVASGIEGSLALYLILMPVAFAISLGVSVPVYLLIERPFSLMPGARRMAQAA